LTIVLNEHHVNTLCAIGIGSNQGERHGLLKRATLLLKTQWKVPFHESSVYETAAWGMPEGTPSFLNQVLLFEWSEAPDAEQVLEVLLDVELALGRQRNARTSAAYESRTIDLDLLFLGDQISSSDRLDLPHPRMTQRKFVLEPLNELCPHFILHPWGKSIHDLWLACEDETPVSVYLAAQ
jgi:2-amino-4-hydroxy-6-hydroxymethyldihydropteridine diphosphokinase